MYMFFYIPPPPPSRGLYFQIFMMKKLQKSCAFFKNKTIEKGISETSIKQKKFRWKRNNTLLISFFFFIITIPLTTQRLVNFQHNFFCFLSCPPFKGKRKKEKKTSTVVKLE